MPAGVSTGRRVTLALLLAAIVGYEAYALWIKRSGETAFAPSARERSLSPEIAGAVTLEQTFVMHADGLDVVRVFPHPSTATPAGTAHLMLVGEGYVQPVATTTLPASSVAAAAAFAWRVPRVDRSAGRIYALRVSVPDAGPGHGLRFEIGPPGYDQGDLSIGGRAFWGDLRFETRAERVRLVDSLDDLRRQAPPVWRSDIILVVAMLLFNGVLVVFVLRLVCPAPTSVPTGAASNQDTRSYNRS
jgi:hypothetical protein